MENPLALSPPVPFRCLVLPRTLVKANLSYTLNRRVLQIVLTKLAGFCWKAEAATTPVHFLRVSLPVTRTDQAVPVHCGNWCKTPHRVVLGTWGSGLSFWVGSAALHSSCKEVTQNTPAQEHYEGDLIIEPTHHLGLMILYPKQPKFGRFLDIV